MTDDAYSPRNSINWGKVFTNTASALFVGIVGTAGLIVWNGATTVDTKITKALDDSGFSVDNLEKLNRSTEQILQVVTTMQSDYDRRLQALAKRLLELESRLDDESGGNGDGLGAAPGQAERDALLRELREMERDQTLQQQQIQEDLQMQRGVIEQRQLGTRQ